MSWKYIFLNVTSCIWSQPSSASKAHLAELWPLFEISIFSNNKLLIAEGAIPTHLALSITIFLNTELVGELNIWTDKSVGVAVVNSVTLIYLVLSGFPILLYWYASVDLIYFLLLS